MNELLAYCSHASGVDQQTVDTVIRCCFEYIVSELAKGNTVDLGDAFGTFVARLRKPHLAESSPRTPKDTRYKVVFREGKEMAQRLKVKSHEG